MLWYRRFPWTQELRSFVSLLLSALVAQVSQVLWDISLIKLPCPRLIRIRTTICPVGFTGSNPATLRFFYNSSFGSFYRRPFGLLIMPLSGLESRISGMRRLLLSIKPNTTTIKGYFT